jgi:hypothetical protein
MKRIIVPALLWAALSAVPSVEAQGLPPLDQRPVNLFGSGPPRSDRTLDLRVSLFGAYDQDVVPFDQYPVGGSFTNVLRQNSGMFSGVNATTTFGKQFRYVSFSLSGRSNGRYYPSLGELGGFQHLGKGSLSVEYKSTRVAASQTIERTPFVMFDHAAGLTERPVSDLPPLTSDQSALGRDWKLYGTTFDLSQGLGERTSVRASASLSHARYGDSVMQTEGVSGRLSQQVTRDLSLVAGYGLQQGTHRTLVAAPYVTRVHTMDLGIEYGRALSFSRKTSVHVSTGSTAIQGVAGPVEYRLAGRARVTQDLGRAWRASAAYDRGGGFAEGFQQSYFADTMTADVNGALGRRITIALNGSYSKGIMGLAASETYSHNVSTSLRFALSRRAALTGEYVAYHYEIRGAATLPDGVPLSLNRNGVRVSLDLWLPLVR